MRAKYRVQSAMWTAQFSNGVLLKQAFTSLYDLWYSLTMNNEERMSQKEWDRRIDAIKVCGANRGPHDYIPVRWKQNEGSEHVTDWMCRVCFCRVSMNTLATHFPELKM